MWSLLPTSFVIVHVAYISMISASCTPLIGNGLGLTGDYFTGNNGSNYFVNYVTTKIDETVNFSWGRGGPAIPSFPTDDFSVRWTGLVQPLYSGDYTFYTSSDDGSRLFVNGQPVINSWVTQAQTERSGSIYLDAGIKYDIVLEYMEQGGEAAQILSWSSSCQPKEVIPASQLYPCRSPRNAAGNGLFARYYAEPALRVIYTTRVDSKIDFNWGTGGPIQSGGRFDRFSIQWTGFVQPRFSGTYTFHASSDDGVRLFVNGQTIVDAWVDRSVTENTGTINLEQGRNYSITYQYYENAGEASVQLHWSHTCEPKAIIPQSQLFSA